MVALCEQNESFEPPKYRLSTRTLIIQTGFTSVRYIQRRRLSSIRIIIQKNHLREDTTRIVEQDKSKYTKSQGRIHRDWRERSAETVERMRSISEGDGTNQASFPGVKLNWGIGMRKKRDRFFNGQTSDE